MIEAFLIGFIFLAPTLASSQETTQNHSAPIMEDVVQDTAVDSCRMTVRGSFNIRTEPHLARRGNGRNTNVCDSTSRGAQGPWAVVNPLGVTSSGSWVKIISSLCPGTTGYVHKNAFRQTDFDALRSGQMCQGQINSSQAAVDSTATPGNSHVPNLPGNTNGHSFPLPRCLGIKNRGGLGHFGAPRKGGRRHNGCDYYAPHGTPIQSPCTGRVSRSAKDHGSAGNMLVISCHSGEQYTFMHMHDSKPISQLRAGASITQGAIVGGVSSSGNARRQAPHLHMEVREKFGRRGNRKFIDPQSLWQCGGDSGK